MANNYRNEILMCDILPNPTALAKTTEINKA